MTTTIRRPRRRGWITTCGVPAAMAATPTAAIMPQVTLVGIISGIIAAVGVAAIAAGTPHVVIHPRRRGRRIVVVIVVFHHLRRRRSGALAMDAVAPVVVAVALLLELLAAPLL